MVYLMSKRLLYRQSTLHAIPGYDETIHEQMLPSSHTFHSTTHATEMK